ncbi:MAG TPA: NrfD/PsrC family molybdoenzyme membrane anchor subunit [Candidatus Acidoferrum sp.]|nr:NrfD/PsrC family molybdoenzyme membrane anchor subunit [Candidatus Acidoferrum sp.]
MSTNGAAARDSTFLEARSDSYYGRPVVKPHVWKAYIPLYFWIGGTAGAAAVECVCARMRGAERLASVEKRAALAGALAAPVLLIADLGRPARFANMLRVFKITSPMSVGSWILASFGTMIGASTAAELLGWTRLSRTLEFGAAAFGPALSTYTAVLVADTATPVWHEAHEVLPFVFAASGIAGAGAIGVAFAPPEEAASARRLMIGGSLGLVIGGQVMEHRLGTLLAEPYKKGEGATLKRFSALLSVCAVGLGVFGRGSVRASRFAAACAVTAGVLERFAVLAAGKQSARDPKYTVEPQRARVDAGPG